MSRCGGPSAISHVIRMNHDGRALNKFSQGLGRRGERIGGRSCASADAGPAGGHSSRTRRTKLAPERIGCIAAGLCSSGVMLGPIWHVNCLRLPAFR